ncbi:5-methylcytosine rRNA methyltransferase NSUN4 [Stomoxys calcitrans]|uniref:5-methylcytosine rRNA methyltransferase NSUN4 n=1 Tax=Stomoxys calcitrans TaxID=35570 RepID=UPI0027E36032|nr:5-methylcytosine rRNA methyltransferase NSUN4 [Stomoxys calcitrans]
MLRSRNFFLIPQRWKSGKTRWSIQQRKKTSTDRALENFDDFYGSVFGKRWKNIRAALLTEHKYVAMVNNFGDNDKTCSRLEMDGAINVKALVQLAKERTDGTPQTSLSSNEEENQMQDRMQAFARKQEEKEIQAIYPENTNETAVPNNLEYGGDQRKEQTIQQSRKTPLMNVTQASVDIDHSRIVDPDHGTGALYDFVPASTIKGMEDWVPESEHYKYYQTTNDFPLKYEIDNDFMFPENLSLYTYEMGNCSEFRPPNKCLTGVLSHYLLDGASVLPPLLLNVKPGERVLDACSAPGGKSLLMLQTLYPEQLVCNDIMESRVNRIRKVMKEYLFDFEERWEGQRVLLNQCDARNLDEYGCYDKVLADVPCTNDRHSLMEDDNNIFKPTRIKERLRIPELQAGILANCLRLLKPGGSLVYSTCSLSPVQNDGVVHMALQKAFNEYGLTFVINDLSYTIQLFADIYRFEYPKGLKYGQMVIPYLPANFGPMYFSKITRTE